MTSVRRTFGRIALYLIIVFALFFIAVNVYVAFNKEKILHTIDNRIKSRVNGTLTVGGMRISLLQDFPHVSVVLYNIRVRDTAWRTHHKDLLKIGKLSIDLNPLALLTGKVRVSQIVIQNGIVYCYTNANGYSNTAAWRTGASGKMPKADMKRKIKLVNVAFIYEDKAKYKFFQFDFKHLIARINNTGRQWTIATTMRTKVAACNFNLKKGSFLKDKMIEGNVRFNYIPATKILIVKKQMLRIDKQSVNINGSFSFQADNPVFSLRLDAPKAILKSVKGWLTPAIAHKLAMIKAARPFKLSAVLHGKMQYRDTPFVHVMWGTHNNTLITPMGYLEKCRLDGYYMNEVYPGMGHSDANSLIGVHHVNAVWANTPFRVDSVKIYDLHNPYLQGNIISSINLPEMNAVTGKKLVAFADGVAQVHLNYKGRLNAGNRQSLALNGYISIGKAKMTYVPRNISFKRCDALLIFKGEDLFMKQVNIETSHSKIHMEGNVLGFTSFFFRSPDDIAIDWSMQSDYLDLSEFYNFVQKRKNARRASVARSSVADNIDRALDESTVTLNASVKKVVYKQFQADDVSGEVEITDDETDLQHIELKQSGGAITLSGNVKQQIAGRSRFQVYAKIDSVYVNKLFYSFNNFGQTALTSGNIEGVFSADVNVSGILLPKSRLLSDSIKGYVDFQLRDGALVHFRPLEKISKIVFKKRNLSYVTFEDIHNKLEIANSKITIHPMEIQSSVLNFGISGIYALDSGTDISLRIPLRNPKKDELAQNETFRKKRTKKGVVLYFRAKSDKGGSVRIDWDKEKQMQQSEN